MNTICLVRGGGFLVGINAEDIVSRTTSGAVPAFGRTRMAELGALLSCKPGRAASPDAPSLELRGQDENVFLLVEEIVEEIEAAAPPAPLPSVCPALTARLFPQTAVCGSVAVPLLNPAQVIPVCVHLGKGIGLIADEEPEPPEEVDAEPEPLIIERDEFFSAAEEERPLIEETEPAAGGQAEQGEQSALNDVFAQDEPVSLVVEEDAPIAEAPSGPDPKEELPEAAPEPGSTLAAVAEESSVPVAATEAAADEERTKTASNSIDEQTFKEVMRWTVARFKQCQIGEDMQLGVEHLPPELAARVRQKGLDRNVIQYLIDQIVLRCQESAQRRKPGEQHGG